MPKWPSNRLSTTHQFLEQRSLGRVPPLSLENQLHHELYSSMLPCNTWDCSNDPKLGLQGGIFNLEFSPDGKLLVAACEQKSFVSFDPLTRKSVHHVIQAHSDCVNCVRFLDSRMFATCSDDTTVALWDVRNLKSKIRTLRGHSNWVKNIEYARDEGILVTSGFDGCVYAWDINSYTEEGVKSNRVFFTSGLMRMRLSPDSSKMVISTSGGYLMVIHDLDLNELAKDLSGFKPNMYRLTQLRHTPVPSTDFSHLFKAKRNRVEFISDFPNGNDAEVISSLQIHPEGWAVVSRNTSSDDRTEWSCVHDIQERPRRGRKRKLSTVSEPGNSSVGRSFSSSDEETPAEPELEPVPDTEPMVQVRITAPLRWEGTTGRFYVRDANETANREREPHLELHIPSVDVMEELENIRRRRRRLLTSVSWDWVDPSSITGRLRRRRVPASSTGSAARQMLPSFAGPSSAHSVNEAPAAVAANSRPSDRTAHFVRVMADLSTHSPFLFMPPSRRPPFSRGHNAGLPPAYKIQENVSRLTHYTQEPNVGRGFIKELCFSPDGRLIASPFGFGVRLLAFNSQGGQLYDALPSTAVHNVEEVTPLCLYELTTNISHSNVVVTTRFSPTHPLMVSGCLNGRVAWHQPVL